MPREVVLGIDFGSSTTSAGALIGDRVELLQDQGDRVIPTVVHFPDRGVPEVGRRAASKALSDPTRTIRSVKRLLGVEASSELVDQWAATHPTPLERRGERLILKLGSGDVAPEQVAAQVLARVRDLAETRFGATVKRVVMTCAAAAPAGYRGALMRAAKIAHLEIVELIAEPIAGALALDLHRQDENRRILICDFGGGTFDVSAVLQQNMRFSPVAVAGDHWLGGDDLDLALAEAMASLIARKTSYDMHRDLVRWNELVYRCELAKRQLSTSRDVPFTMSEAYVHEGARRDLRFTIDAGWAEGVWASLLARARTVIEDGLARAGWTPESVDVVGLVGGSSQTLAFRRMISEMFDPGRVTIPHDAETAVAIGATLLTARHQNTTSPVRTLVA
jgi:molecular chaperone DnaK